MIGLDCVAALSTLTFIYAVRSGNVVNLFFSAALRSTIVSLYEPVTKSIFPMFMSDAEDLKRAATLNGSAWVSSSRIKMIQYMIQCNTVKRKCQYSYHAKK